MNTKATLITWFAVAVATTTVQASYNFTNFAGQPGGIGNADGTGPAARFNYPNGVVADNQGNVFVADTQNHTIRRITLAGVVITIAGSPGLAGNVDGTGSAARFDAPTGLAIDASGNLYVADYGSSTIRKLTLSGTSWTVKTIAGIAGVTGKANGSGTAATFSSPFGIAVDGFGNLYVTDTGNQQVRKITASGVVSTLISNGVSGTLASNYVYLTTNMFFDLPQGIALDSVGNIYVADAGAQGGAIYKFTPGGENVLSGTTPMESSLGNPSGITVDYNGNIYEANRDNGFIVKFSVSGSTYSSTSIGSSLTEAMGVAVDQNGNVFIANTDNQVIEEIPADGEAESVLAGQSAAFGTTTNIGEAARFHNPEGVAIDSSSNVYVADTDNQRIAVITPIGFSTALAGTITAGYADGPGPDAVFNLPDGVAVDPSGNVYVVDSNNNRIQKISPSGKITTIVTGLNGPDGLAYSGGNLYFVNRNADTVDMVSAQGGPVTVLNFPAHAMTGIAVDPAGDVYVTDDSANVVLKAPPGGAASVLETNTPGGVGLNSPSGVALDSTDDVYVADAGNNRIVEITQAGFASVVAGSNTFGFTNGTGTNALFHNPTGVVADSATNLYIVDQANDAIRMITPAGVVTTIAGSYPTVVAGSSNGIGTNALFNNPFLVAIDAATNLYVSDTGNELIRKLAPGANGEVVTTFAGDVGVSSPSAKFNSPSDVAVDAGGNVYVADQGNNMIREISPGGIVTTIAGTSNGASAGIIGSLDGPSNTASFYSPASVAVDGTSNVYVADTFNHTIRKITAGVVSTIAGSAGYNGSSNGVGSAARFWAPTGVAVDPSGSNVYVADTYNDTIRQFVPSNGSWVVSTIAGTSGTAGSKDGAGTAATFNHPAGISVYTVSNAETLYVADSYNQTIRMLTNKSGTSATGWSVVTVGGTAGVIGGGLVNGLNGVGTAAEFDYPLGVAVDLLGNVLVADSGNNRISLDLVVDGDAFTSQGSGLAADLLYGSGSGSSSGTATTGSGKDDTFTQSSFASVVGLYNGLFATADGAVEGMLERLKVNANGTYSAVILINGASHSISGKFASDGQVTNTQISHGAVTVELTLSLPPEQGVAGTVSGSTGGVAWSAPLTAEVTDTTLAAADYTVLISQDTTAAASPAGQGYALIAEKSGVAKITGTLADGTAFSQSAAVAATGDVPVFISLYGGKGLLTGMINLTNTSAATLTWEHPARTSGLFKTAFTSSCPTAVSLWTESAAGSVLTNLVNLSVVDSTDTNSTPYVVTISDTGKIKGVDDAPVSGTVTLKTGLISVTAGAHSSKVTGHGVVLLTPGGGGGYFLSGTKAGTISLTP